VFLSIIKFIHYCAYNQKLQGTNVSLDPYQVSVQAAQLYRSLRKKGVTIRKANDCLIACYAIHFDIELCHNASDVDLIGKNSSLKIWKPI